LLYHLGCGRQRIDGFVNVDIQPSEATDLVLDLNTLADLPNDDVDGFFSHAFFEHLYRDSRVTHLCAARERVQPDGFVCYLGLPDFQRVAELYLTKAPGIEGPIFDLHNVYRYTHGHPEMGGTEWLPQLHKSLFDVVTVDHLLSEAGFPSFVIFRYVFPGESRQFNLSLGFYATRTRRAISELEADARAFLTQFDGRFLDLSTLSLDAKRSRPEAVAHAISSVPGLALRRLIYRASCRLAQMA
jgi:predicted SAM-dependent methyltransferase